MVQNSDGTTSLIPASSSTDAKGLTEDQDIDFEEFCIAASRMVVAMAAADWPPERIRMMASFWSNLQVHPFRSSQDDIDRRTLLLYQAEQRRLWHHAMTAPNAGYDLSVINDEVLRDTKERLFWNDRSRKERERELRVRSSPYCMTPHANCIDTHTSLSFSTHLSNAEHLYHFVYFITNTLLHACL
jgi:hypothetical protein